MGDVIMCEISALRKRRGWSQKELAKVLKISQQSVSRLENCEPHKIPSEILLKLATVFQVSPNYLLGFQPAHDNTVLDKRNIIFDIYTNLDKINKETWIMIGQRLVESQSPSSVDKHSEDTGGHYDD